MNYLRVILFSSVLLTSNILAVNPNTKQLVTAEVAKTTQFDELPLPKSLTSLPHVMVHHIKVTQQTGCQCGSRSVANALAVQDLVCAGQPLTAGNIRSKASCYDRILINRVIDDYELVQLALKNKLHNAHIVCKNPVFKDAALWPYIVTSIETWDNSLEAITTAIKNESNILMQLICNTGGHWVLLSIIKHEGQKPQILYMDSCNGQLQDSSFITAYTKYLDHAIA
jgi:hypothetical protein